MAYSDEQVRSYLQNNLSGASDSEIAAAMNQFGVGPEQLSRVTNVSVPEIQSRYEAATGVPYTAPANTTSTTGPGAVTVTTGGGTAVGTTTTGAGGVTVGGAGGRDEWLTGTSYDATRIPSNFNWQQYVNLYPDLRTAGIDTEAEAKRHYALYGASENRTVSGTTTGFTDAQVQQYLRDRPGMSDTDIAADMIRFGISLEQMSRATGMSIDDVRRRFSSAVTPVTPITPINPITTNVPPGSPGNVDMVTVMPTPAISSGVVPQMPTQYVTPSGATTSVPTGVTPLAVPMLNMRNIVNQGVVPSYVAAPKSTSNMQFQPIENIGTQRIF